VFAGDTGIEHGDRLPRIARVQQRLQLKGIRLGLAGVERKDAERPDRPFGHAVAERENSRDR
jgi:hypothetical protein